MANITKGFAATGIWPLQPTAMTAFMQPSACYIDPAVQEEDNGSNFGTAQHMTEPTEDYVPETQGEGGSGQQYFVEADVGSDSPEGESTNSEASSELETENTGTRQNLFPLPEVQHPGRRVSCGGELPIDYSKSIIMTSNDYIAVVTAKAQTLSQESARSARSKRS